jgi:nucleoside-diphosphate-sugar epimerase
MWFARALTRKGHTVIAITRSGPGELEGLRAERLGQLPGCEIIYGVAYGGSEFLDVVKRHGPLDLFCHHGADTVGYRSPDFDALGAAESATRQIVSVLAALRDVGCHRLLLTGSIFEANEGAGCLPLRAFSPYGLSKTLVSEILSYYADREGFGFGKFVIPNPFGPYEEQRFTNYLVRCWSRGEVATVNTPAYVRDNVPVSLLAMAYENFAVQLPDLGQRRINPSFYVGSQGAFAERFAREIGKRLNIVCSLSFARQTVFPEPKTRINTDLLEGDDFGWNEDDAWDELAKYYAVRFNLSHR